MGEPPNSQSGNKVLPVVAGTGYTTSLRKAESSLETTDHLTDDAGGKEKARWQAGESTLAPHASKSTLLGGLSSVQNRAGGLADSARARGAKTRSAPPRPIERGLRLKPRGQRSLSGMAPDPQGERWAGRIQVGRGLPPQVVVGRLPGQWPRVDELQVATPSREVDGRRRA